MLYDERKQPFFDNVRAHQVSPPKNLLLPRPDYDNNVECMLCFTRAKRDEILSFLLVVQHLIVCLMCSPTGSSRVRWNQKSFTLTLMRSVSEAENIITLAVAKIQWWSCCSVGSDSRHFHCHAVLPSLSPLHVIKSMIFCFSSRPNVVRTHATTIDTTMILFWNKSTE